MSTCGGKSVIFIMRNTLGEILPPAGHDDDDEPYYIIGHSISDPNVSLTCASLSSIARLPCDIQTRGLRLLLCGKQIS